jgi:leader peptidase (prepilin peptidase)/N-methyltransferase
MRGDFLDYIFICILGLDIGSFLNVCIYRIPMEKSIAFPPSHCTNCKHNLNPLDLVPVFSYIFLRGKCRYCDEKISIRYPLIEILNGLLYLIVYLKFGLDVITIKYCILVSLLIVISAIDFDTQFVFTSTTIFGGIVGVLFILLQYVLYKNNVLDLILGGILGAIIIGLIVFLTRGMGEGDIEIAAVCGVFLGVKGILLGLFLAIVLGGIIGIIVLALKLKKAKEKIAFGPFIAIGSLISMIYGTEILKIYWSLLM